MSYHVWQASLHAVSKWQSHVPRMGLEEWIQDVPHLPDVKLASVLQKAAWGSGTEKIVMATSGRSMS